MALRSRRPPAAALAHTGSRSAWPWATAGALAGGLLALLWQAPAAWLATAVANASQQRVLLADARGSVWQGSAFAVLSAGPGSPGAAVLPGRLHWQLGLAPGSFTQLELRLRQACCLNGEVNVQLAPGLGRLRLTVPPPAAGGAAGAAGSAGHVGKWPATWLAGLGAPFNTLRLGGSISLATDGLALEAVAGRWSVAGKATLGVSGLSSPLVPLDALGSYRLSVDGAGAGSEGARLNLATTQGPLLMSGQGQWVGGRLHFRGQASAEPGSEAVLNNLLNLLGQRQGALSLLQIG